MKKIGLLKKLLPARQCKRMRLAMSDRIRDIEFLLAAKNLDGSFRNSFSDTVKQELHDAMRTPLSFQEFEQCRQHLTVGKSLGPSGLTNT